MATCDLEQTATPHIPHFRGDVAYIQDLGWDLVIMHPPCTFLSNAGVSWLYTDPGRRQSLVANAAQYRSMAAAKARFKAIESTQRRVANAHRPTRRTRRTRHHRSARRPRARRQAVQRPCNTRSRGSIACHARARTSRPASHATFALGSAGCVAARARSRIGRNPLDLRGHAAREEHALPARMPRTRGEHRLVRGTAAYKMQRGSRAGGEGGGRAG